MQKMRKLSILLVVSVLQAGGILLGNNTNPPSSLPPATPTPSKTQSVESGSNLVYLVLAGNNSSRIPTPLPSPPPSSTQPPSPCPFGGIWFPPNKGLRCHCQSYAHNSYYVCEPTPAATTSAGSSCPSSSSSSSNGIEGGNATIASTGESIGGSGQDDSPSEVNLDVSNTSSSIGSSGNVETYIGMRR